MFTYVATYPVKYLQTCPASPPGGSQELHPQCSKLRVSCMTNCETGRDYLHHKTIRASTALSPPTPIPTPIPSTPPQSC